MNPFTLTIARVYHPFYNRAMLGVRLRDFQADMVSKFNASGLKGAQLVSEITIFRLGSILGYITFFQECNLTPPESPSDLSYRLKPFAGELNPNTEFYGIKGSPNLGRPVIYFIAVIDILTRYGMRKRTAQTYKTVKHGAGSEITTVRPEVYGRRLLDFIGNCIE
ncbi:unnamed protein product [Dibothriocephalus latus]|uniref:PIPK domain-containing protein n=1 Tax=Dibothriocephalus latus TaxID=60516 RepID=A0A3P7LCP9_DIBLA|nr:unnamed protein product [Dibothriocephalus latus]